MRIQTVLVNAAVIAASAFAPNAVYAGRGYTQHNLVSDVTCSGDQSDSHLVNAWGLVAGPATPWWVNANGTGTSLIFNAAGVPASLVVTVPVVSGAQGPSTPTGIAFNGTPDFEVGPGSPALFIFATEDGTISGWSPNLTDRTQAAIKVPNTTSAVYKGIAIGSLNGKNLLYAANFKSGAIDVFDANYVATTVPGGFKDSTIPSDFAPFNIQNIGGWLYVTFAKQKAGSDDDQAGPGLGFVDQFTPDGNLVMRLEHGLWMNAPWGVALAPATFGEASGRLLVGNFGSGEIATFDPDTGIFQGMLMGRRHPIKIDGLWGIAFGNGGNAGPVDTLYFTAGPGDESHGLFGTLTPSAPPAGSSDGSSSSGGN